MRVAAEAAVADAGSRLPVEPDPAIAEQRAAVARYAATLAAARETARIAEEAVERRRAQIPAGPLARLRGAFSGESRRSRERLEKAETAAASAVSEVRLIETTVLRPAEQSLAALERAHGVREAEAAAEREEAHRAALERLEAIRDAVRDPAHQRAVEEARRRLEEQARGPAPRGFSR